MSGKTYPSFKCFINALPYHDLSIFIIPHCNVVWGAASNTVLGSLIILQKRAVRLITHSRRCSSSTPLFARLHLLKLIDINHFQTIIFMCRLKNNQLPLSCMNYITITNPDRPYSTRHFHFFITSRFRTIIRQNSVSIRGPKLWDSFPIDIQNSSSLHLLRKRLSNMYINLYSDS